MFMQVPRVRLKICSTEKREAIEPYIRRSTANKQFIKMCSWEWAAKLLSRKILARILQIRNLVRKLFV